MLILESKCVPLVPGISSAVVEGMYIHISGWPLPPKGTHIFLQTTQMYFTLGSETQQLPQSGSDNSIGSLGASQTKRPGRERLGEGGGEGGKDQVGRGA